MVAPVGFTAADVIIQSGVAEVHVFVSPLRGAQIRCEDNVCNVSIFDIFGLGQRHHSVESLIWPDLCEKFKYGLIVGVSWHVDIACRLKYQLEREHWITNLCTILLETSELRIADSTLEVRGVLEMQVHIM